MKRYGVRPSVSISVPVWVHSSRLDAAVLLLWARQAEDIDRLLHDGVQRANAGSATFSVYVIAEH